MYRYLSRLVDTLMGRRDIVIETLQVERPFDSQGEISGRLRFYDGSLLIFEELAVKTDHTIRKPRYRYHYQRADGALVFRYDASPHYPHLPAAPHHKHIGNRVVPARPPDLSDVLREIDALLYSPGASPVLP